ncbi:hypothetical protein VTL71DRAFT_14117 [Oculimacula yallundae]|uniref:Uncharacterized protein n=1 Tax=Oculimacula yallundae TaxID=86028 RepID=A0ABR4CHJ8_9HELO
MFLDLDAQITTTTTERKNARKEDNDDGVGGSRWRVEGGERKSKVERGNFLLWAESGQWAREQGRAGQGRAEQRGEEDELGWWRSV